MSSVLIVCLTVLLVVVITTASYLYLAVTERQREQLEAGARQTRADSVFTGLQDLEDKIRTATARLSDAELSLEQAMTDVRAEIVSAQQDTTKSLSAFSERMAIFEAALKAAVAEMVNVTGYSSTKYQELIAAQVRRSTGQKPGRPGQ